MTWKELLDANRVEKHVTTRQELDDLRKAVDRNLQDANLLGLSADNKFGLAYEAGLLLSKMAVACAGYRVKGQGAHQTTFTSLKLVIGAPIVEMAAYLDRCRRKRNEISYDTAGLVSDTEAKELLTKLREFQNVIETWIAKNHANFASK
jgi:hypothetical protein